MSIDRRGFLQRSGVAAAGIGAGMAAVPRAAAAAVQDATARQVQHVGGHQGASILEEFNPSFFEEPVSPENVDETARVAAHTSISIAQLASSV